jgi:hypothetical protein
MSFTMTRTASESFTLTHAKYLASKVTTDMLRCQQSYREPSNDAINNYGTELALLLRDDYVESYEFGFRRESKRILSWSYTIDVTGLTSADDRPGRIVTGVDVSTASFFNYLTYSAKWGNLSQDERDAVRAGLPVQRVSCAPPGDGPGYWQHDLSYSASGVVLNRKNFRPS